MNAEGCDVSHWEGVINWSIAKESVDFAIIKATEGISFVDGQFYANKNGIQTQNLPWGAYHFFRSNYSGTTQAQHFVNTVGAGCNVYVCDVETMDGQSGQTVINRVNEFMIKLKALTGKRGVIYTSPGFWNPLPTPPWARNYYDLWVANWYASQPLLPADWDYWKIWQYSAIGSITGIPGAVDLDQFNGDVYAVEQYFGNGVVPEPTEFPLVAITANALYVRSAPMGTIKGTLPKGLVVAVTGETLYLGQKWYMSGDNNYFSSKYTEPV